MEKEHSLEQGHEGRLPQTASHFPVPSRLSHPDLSDAEIGLGAISGPPRPPGNGTRAGPPWACLCGLPCPALVSVFMRAPVYLTQGTPVCVVSSLIFPGPLVQLQLLVCARAGGGGAGGRG